MNLEIRKFNMRSIQFQPNTDPDKCKGPVIVFIGRRETGKSYLLLDLLSYNQNIPIGTVISGTEIANGFYNKIMPKMLIHNNYSSDIITNILKRQKPLLKEVRKDIELYGRTAIDPRTFTVLDDCLWDDSWAKDPVMRLLFMNGRHWNIMLLITMQYPLGIPPRLRTNIDYVFILREPYLNNRRKIYDNYASCFPTFESFCQVMDQCTENYECLVINNNAKSNKLQDIVFWYKAEPHSNVKLCANQYWEISKNLSVDDDDDEPYNEKKLMPKRANAPKINVKKAAW